MKIRRKARADRKRRARDVISRLLFASLVAGVAMLSLTGCYTVQGIGEDITSLGQSGEEMIYKKD